MPESELEQAECNSLIKEDVSLKLMLDKINQSSCCQVSVFYVLQDL
jgi:hypothetical protein